MYVKVKKTDFNNTIAPGRGGYVHLWFKSIAPEITNFFNNILIMWICSSLVMFNNKMIVRCNGYTIFFASILTITNIGVRMQVEDDTLT
jgi:hypothetical protein